MSDKPILFSAPMVRAILDGRKTQTRRVIKVTKKDIGPGQHMLFVGPKFNSTVYRFAPPIREGDTLWVREAWRTDQEFDKIKPSDLPIGSPLYYEADPRYAWEKAGKLRPGMFMPRLASRLPLKVTGVKVERLQDISEADAIAEGIGEEHGVIGVHCYGGNPVEISGYRYFTGIDEIDSAIDGGFEHAEDAYAALWESINGKGSWEENPWVAAYTFERIL